MTTRDDRGPKSTGFACLTARSSESGLTRRAFAERVARHGLGLLGLVGGLAASHSTQADPAPTAPLPLPVERLERSPFVYVSPLRSNGTESRCHAELWYAWLDESVVVTVASDRWKATALARGLDRARLWVGDHGRWKTWYGGRNEAFRESVPFDARVQKVEDPELFARLLAVYEEKYPDEIADWRDLMRRGNADGSRSLLRYTPIRP